MANGSDVILPVSRVGLRLATDERLVALVRRGSGRMSAVAFEVLYERHVRGLLSFCIYMLGSRDDAEDAVQAAFAAAHRSLLSNGREVSVRPWLFAIARNECIDILRKRRPTVELNGEPATTGDPVKTLQLREEVRGIFEDVRKLPERQRTALVLAEVDGLSQSEIGGILGVRAEQVKAYVYQARTNLISDRGAREADCADIREQLATSHGPALRRSRIRRHTRSCQGCRAYAESVRRQQRQLTALVPVVPTLGLKCRLLEQLFGLGGADPGSYAETATIGSAVAGTIAELAGGGIKALAVKLAAGVLAVGVTAGVGMTALNTSHGSHETSAESASSTTSSAAGRPVAMASIARGGSSRSAGSLGIAAGGVSAHPSPAESPGTAGEAAPTSGTPAAGNPVEFSEGQPTPGPADSAPSLDHSTAAPPATSGETWSNGSTEDADSEEHAQIRRERELAHNERQKTREEHKAGREQGREKPSDEESPEVGMSEAPKRTSQEHQEMHEEHERKREERKREREERHGSK